MQAVCFCESEFCNSLVAQTNPSTTSRHLFSNSTLILITTVCWRAILCRIPSVWKTHCPFTFNFNSRRLSDAALHKVTQWAPNGSGSIARRPLARCHRRRSWWHQNTTSSNEQLSSWCVIVSQPQTPRLPGTGMTSCWFVCTLLSPNWLFFYSKQLFRATTLIRSTEKFMYCNG